MKKVLLILKLTTMPYFGYYYLKNDIDSNPWRRSMIKNLRGG